VDEEFIKEIKERLEKEPWKCCAYCKKSSKHASKDDFVFCNFIDAGITKDGVCNEYERDKTKYKFPLEQLAKRLKENQ